ncbi:DUF418 domain-containing protein [Sphingomonas sp. LHG3406-1]|uniref:DUF418 domain-containing protein n=1 Tax=Sphingomonas sp. LHG3406-1 TaxID=2804617 RepID=UPI002602E712|nr:DUF418 domain-containing protein [Sphingomonas sp. LHG3406-1]
MTMGPELSRIGEAERIPSLDVVRGFAILFILLMNIPWMGSYGFILFDPRYPSWTPADYWTTLFVNSVLEGTQRGLLELLFGAGIMIMARRAMTPDGPVGVADLHYRRNLWLIVFGLANALVLMWMGDILLVYGIAAIFLFPFRRMGPKGQCAMAALFLGVLLLISVAEHREAVAERAKVERMAAREKAGAPLRAEEKKQVEEMKARDLRRSQLPGTNSEQRAKIDTADKERSGGFIAYWKAQRDGWVFIMLNFFWFIEAEIIATMLIGMALYQWGVIQGRARRQTYVLLLVAGYGIGLTLRSGLWLDRLSFQPGLISWERQFEDIARLGVTLGHLALLHLALQSGVGRRLLAPFAAVGKIPLTVYLFTSLLMMWLVFAPWGLGLFGRFGMAQLMLLALAVIAVELVAANLWVMRFANGPAEWLWKSLAYEKREPFLRPRVPVVAAPAE